MAKVQIKTEKLTLYGSFFLKIVEQFDPMLSLVIDSALGRLMLGGSYITLDAPSLISSNASHI